ncbi:MAG: hypothetical protein N2D54_09600, partial [Chloroflexota bacterium]
MNNLADAGKLRNAFLMLGLGTLIVALFGLATLSGKAAGGPEHISGVDETAASKPEEQSPKATPTPPLAVKTNTPLPTLTPSPTPIALLYNTA